MPVDSLNSFSEINCSVYYKNHSKKICACASPPDKEELPVHKCI